MKTSIMKQSITLLSLTIQISDHSNGTIAVSHLIVLSLSHRIIITTDN